MSKSTNKKKSNPKSNKSINKSSKKDSIKWHELNKAEQMSVVCRHFIKGKTLAEIAKAISTDYQIDFKRQSPYKILSNAAKDKWLKYVPPTTYLLNSELKKEYNWLKSHVVQTSQFEDVAHHGAEQLMEMLKDFKAKGEDEIHLGFSGGHAMRYVALAFEKMVTQPGPSIPKHIVLHAIVAGFDVYDPTTDPNTFFTLFQTPNPAGIVFSYVGLHAPPVISCDQYENIQKLDGIKESYKERDKIDIIVTSSTNLSDQHSLFLKYMSKSKECLDYLNSMNCIGDMLWQPLGPQDPIQHKTNIRAMSIWELNELPGFIKKRKSVLLVIGPCSVCNEPKSDILRAILNQKKKIITHLVADSLSVRGMLSSEEDGN